MKKQSRQRALENQVRRLRQQLALLRQQSDRYVRWRLVIFIGGAVVSAVTLLTAGLWWWIGVSVPLALAFLAVVYVHRQVEGMRQRYEIWLAIKKSHLARMALDWNRLPAAAPVSAQMDHPFAVDLDLIGQRSLHQLLDTAVTREGSLLLRDWLLETNPDLVEIIDRQSLVRELVRLPLFRDKLRLHIAQINGMRDEKWPGQRLLDWLARHESLSGLKPAFYVLSLLAAANLVLAFLYLSDVLPPWWVATWAVYAALSLRYLPRIGPIFQEAFFLRDGLEQIYTVFDFLERYRYGCNPHLKQLCTPFRVTEERPSRQLRRIRQVAAAVGLQKNPFLWMGLNALIPWDIFFALRLNQGKQQLATLLPNWLDIWFELEALNSLANHAYHHPDYIFPALNQDQSILFQARDLGHPLLPDEARVGNDFEISQLGTIGIITGSNMAGKSSFLRTIGINLCLAYAGGPVLAQSLHTTLFRLFSTIRITDSVTDGISYFYAEVQRLRSLLSELEREDERPLLFLIDEIFRGTNNRERLIGSRAYIRALLGQNGVGLVATHDLELVHLADELPGISNHHFRDEVVNGRMVFDYKLRAGPCPTSNALKIMRLAGLPILSD